MTGQPAQAEAPAAHVRQALSPALRIDRRVATAEEIVQKFPALELACVYQVVGYYLNRHKELAGYPAARASAEEAMIAQHPDWSPSGLRERLTRNKSV